jgi:VWFA-related protein
MWKFITDTTIYCDILTKILENMGKGLQRPQENMKILTITVGILLLAGSVASQVVTSPSPQSDDVVTITTTLVRIDVTVTDKDGNPVRGLSADDFEIFENDKLQKITDFSFIETESRGRGRNPENAKNSTAVSAPALPTKLRPDQVGRTIALVVDDLGLSFSSIGTVKQSLKKFVDNQMQYGDLVAIVRTGSGAGFLQQFTADKRVLYAAIDRIRWNSRGKAGISIFQPRDPSDSGATGAAIPDDLGVTGPDDSAKAMAADARLIADDFRRQQEEFRSDVFAVGTLGAVNYVVQGMSKLPGRKALVLFSDGFTTYEQDRYDRENKIKRPSPRITSALESLTESANRNGVLIYPMDARGVVNSLLLSAEDSFDDLDRSGGFSAMQTAGLERSTDLAESQQGLRMLARGTGGFAFLNNNDLNKGIGRVLADQNGYYLLGYQPDEETFDPKKIRFNRLSVKLKRPGLRIRYRNGFYGIADADASATPKAPRDQIYSALASPFDLGDIKLQLTSLFANDSKLGNFIRTMVFVDGKSLTFVDDGNGWQSARYNVAALLFGEKNTVVDEISRVQTLRATSETLKEIKEKGFVATILMPVKKPGAYQLRLVLRDDVSSRLGSASEFIRVPNLKKDQLFISGLLLQRINDTVQTPVSQVFQSDEQRDLAIRTFTSGTALRVGFGIYNAKTGAENQTGNLSVQYRIFSEGREIFASKDKPLAVLDRSDPRRIIAQDEIRLGRSIRPGTYILQVIVRDGNRKGDSGTTFEFTDFDVSQ